MTRQTWLFVAFGALAVSSLLVSIGAWLLLWREWRGRLERKSAGRHRA